MYEKVKWFDENFIAIGSVEDERLIKDLNKKAAGIKKADNIKKESKEVVEQEGTKKRKLGTRKKMKSRKRRFRQALAIPEQTATGKEISNPFMAGEDCWDLEVFTTYCCWFNIGAASKDLGASQDSRCKPLMLSLSDLMSSGDGDTNGGSDDEGSAAANSVMHASADGDRGV
ncbi:hypothetical protein Tco_0746213 [Tanacetum coccineum]